LRADRRSTARREDSILPVQAAHIAVMRPVELVVKYIEGEAFPDHRFEWAGVFVCSDDDRVEQAFASAEPPAHDDWIPDMLPKGHEKTFVNVALRRLKEAAKTYAFPQGNEVVDGSRGPSLAHTATIMGSMLESASSRGPGLAPGGGSGGGARRPLSPVRFTRLELDDGGNPEAVFEVDLLNDGADSDLALEAVPHLVMDGGATGSGDAVVEFDEAVSSLSMQDLEASGGSLVVGKRSGTVTCRVPVPEDAAVGVRFRLISGAGS